MTFDKETLKPMYQMVIGEAGESCAFYIASRLGMPDEMLKRAVKEAYGESGDVQYQFMTSVQDKKFDNTKSSSVIQKDKIVKKSNIIDKFHIGDSVMILPEKRIGIVCQPVNEKGVLRVQLPDKKIWINHKRVKLQVAASQLYPEDYDFSIIFDSVENRKLRHDMDRKYVEGEIVYDED
jgi:dsDNA-specific endonuclease/ATPase MutS2